MQSRARLRRGKTGAKTASAPGAADNRAGRTGQRSRTNGLGDDRHGERTEKMILTGVLPWPPVVAPGDDVA